MRLPAPIGAATCFLLLSLPLFARAQTPPVAPTSPSPLLRVFLDCGRCDEQYIRQDVGFVDYVRDRAVADLHVLVTSQPTGGGGDSWVVRFIGLAAFQGQDRELTFSTPPATTEDDIRKAFARVLKLGLVGYVANTPTGAQLDVTWKKPEGASQTTAATDPWNFWVFRVNLNGNMNGERSSRSRSTRLDFSGNRTTDRWKVNLNTNGSYNTNSFDLDDGTSIRSITSSWNVNALVVKSAGPKWSLGGRASASHSSFSNTHLSFSAAPGFEYDVFPYSESSKRSLTLQYTVGVTRYKYAELTVFDKLDETVPNHQVRSMLALRQPWGSVEMESGLTQHLNHPDRYRASVFGGGEVKVFKGFSVNLFGEYERISDQISLRKGVTSEAEVLLRLQQRATNYSYFMYFGVSYSFGSIYNNVVNTRFGR